MQKKYKITLPDGEVIYSVQEEEPDISAECKTTIIVDDEEYEYDGEYDESDVDVEEIPMNFDDTQYSAKKALKNFIATKPFDIKHTITFKASVLKKVIEQNIDFAYLDGSTTNREEVVNHFKQDEEKQVFLISIKAGGVGLNLTEADYVFILDPWWNPAVEQQAIDRTHRIGQKNNVFIYKFITRNTVEEKILALQGRKKQIADSLIITEESFIKTLTAQDIKAILE